MNVFKDFLLHCALPIFFLGALGLSFLAAMVGVLTFVDLYVFAQKVQILGDAGVNVETAKELIKLLK
jgi:uncharacterized membrane protein